MNKAKILIVDDEEGIRKQLSWALTGDFQVLQAQDKDMALGLVRDEKPDLVALDVSLIPGSTNGMSQLSHRAAAILHSFTPSLIISLLLKCFPTIPKNEPSAT